MADLAAIRAEIRGCLAGDDLADCTGYDHVRPSPALPSFSVGACTRIAYHPDYGAGTELQLRLTIEAARENHEAAQRLFDRWLSKPGPLTNLEKHPTDVWESLTIVSASEPRALGDPAAGEIASLAVEILIDITT